MTIDFKDRVAIVTGAGGGLGRAYALELARRGAKVVVNDLGGARDGTGHSDAALAVVQEIEAAGGEAFSNGGSVTEYDQMVAMVEQAKARWGRVDILINNAGIAIRKQPEVLTVEEWRKVLSINLDGAFYCTKAVLPQMFDRKDGVIVNVVSVAGKRANPLGGAAYVAAKFGMGGLGLVLSNEEKDSGVRVSNIYPGEIDTPILKERPKPVTDEQRAVILKPEDVAEAVLFVTALPPRVSIPELVIKPTAQMYW